MDMSKQDWLAIVILMALIFTAGYFTLIFAKTQTNLLLGITLLWAILPPILSNLPYSFKYVLILPSPIFGSWFLLITASVGFGFLFPYWLILAPIFSLLIVMISHVLTRGRVMVWKIPLVSLSRTSLAMVSVFFILFGVILMSPSQLLFDTPTLISAVAVVFVAYVALSMLLLNSSYRLFVLSRRVNTQNLDKDLETIWSRIEKKFPQNPDCQLLQYYFDTSYTAFIEGDYEKSLMWGYRAIREPTIVDPKKYVDDKRGEKQSFSDIRNTLEHSRRKGHVNAKDIRQTMKELFDASLDLVEREIILLNRITTEQVK